MAQKEIKNKISAVKKTQTITSAMQLVAASKIRKAERQMATSDPYAAHIREVMEHIASSHADCLYPYWKGREQVRRVGYIVISTDRGLCGGLNINLFRKVLADAQNWHAKNVATDWCLFGTKAKLFFKTITANVVAQAERLGDAPTIANLVGNVQVMLKAYAAGTIDRVFIAYNNFISKMKQTPEIMQLLPVIPSGVSKKHLWDYIYEPEPKILLEHLLVRYIEMQVYQAVVDNIASEYAARMVAMKNATDSANEILDELKLIYNKARQEAITREIAEITGGVAALQENN